MTYFAAYVGLSMLIGTVAAKVAVVQVAKGSRPWIWGWEIEDRRDMLIYAWIAAVLWPVSVIVVVANAVGAAVWGLLSGINSRMAAWMDEDPVALERHRMKRKALQAAASSHEVAVAEEEVLA